MGGNARVLGLELLATRFVQSDALFHLFQFSIELCDVVRDSLALFDGLCRFVAQTGDKGLALL
jgi:hypothetical protein